MPDPYTAAQVTTTNPATETRAVELRRVSKLFGSFVALRDVSLTLPRGSSVMLLGPNGAGKSTLLKLLAGLAQPSYGDLLLFGGAPGAGRGRVAYMGHQTMLYDELTATENLRYLLGLEQPRTPAEARAGQVRTALLEVGLDPDNPRRVGEYSQGMRQRAALARVLLTAPELLLLDEPFANLDVGSVGQMLIRLQRFLAEADGNGPRRTLVLTTHQADLARSLANRTLTLENGRLLEGEAAPRFDEVPRASTAPVRAEQPSR